MKAQEVVTVLTTISQEELYKGDNTVKIYPELNVFFDKGMYIESIAQTCLENGKCIITFLFRYYNMSQSKEN